MAVPSFEEIDNIPSAITLCDKTKTFILNNWPPGGIQKMTVQTCTGPAPAPYYKCDPKIFCRGPHDEVQYEVRLCIDWGPYHSHVDMLWGIDGPSLTPKTSNIDKFDDFDDMVDSNVMLCPDTKALIIENWPEGGIDKFTYEYCDRDLWSPHQASPHRRYLKPQLFCWLGDKVQFAVQLRPTGLLPHGHNIHMLAALALSNEQDGTIPIEDIKPSPDPCKWLKDIEALDGVSVEEKAQRISNELTVIFRKEGAKTKFEAARSRPYAWRPNVSFQDPKPGDQVRPVKYDQGLWPHLEVMDLTWGHEAARYEYDDFLKYYLSSWGLVGFEDTEDLHRYFWISSEDGSVVQVNTNQKVGFTERLLVVDNGEEDKKEEEDKNEEEDRNKVEVKKEEETKIEVEYKKEEEDKMEVEDKMEEEDMMEVEDKKGEEYDSEEDWEEEEEDTEEDTDSENEKSDSVLDEDAMLITDSEYDHETDNETDEDL
ncbi:MAG: hypothetical protein Q9174_006191 [Haloplaca sp. 1 TL-2023]